MWKEETYLDIIRKNGMMIQYVKEQTEELCIEAIKQNWRSITLIKHLTENICLEAVKQEPMAIEKIPNIYRSQLVCREALVRKPIIFSLLTDPNKDLCYLAISLDGTNIRYIKNPTEEMSVMAVKQNGMALTYITNKTDFIIKEAIKQNPTAIRFVKNPTLELWDMALKLDISLIDRMYDLQLLKLYSEKIRKEKIGDMTLYMANIDNNYYYSIGKHVNISSEMLRLLLLVTDDKYEYDYTYNYNLELTGNKEKIMNLINEFESNDESLLEKEIVF